MSTHTTPASKKRKASTTTPPDNKKQPKKDKEVNSQDQIETTIADPDPSAAAAASSGTASVSLTSPEPALPLVPGASWREQITITAPVTDTNAILMSLPNYWRRINLDLITVEVKERTVNKAKKMIPCIFYDNGKAAGLSVVTPWMVVNYGLVGEGGCRECIGEGLETLIYGDAKKGKDVGPQRTNEFKDEYVLSVVNQPIDGNDVLEIAGGPAVVRADKETTAYFHWLTQLSDKIAREYLKCMEKQKGTLDKSIWVHYEAVMEAHAKKKATLPKPKGAHEIEEYVAQLFNAKLEKLQSLIGQALTPFLSQKGVEELQKWPEYQKQFGHVSSKSKSSSSDEGGVDAKLISVQETAAMSADELAMKKFEEEERIKDEQANAKYKTYLQRRNALWFDPRTLNLSFKQAMWKPVYEDKKQQESSASASSSSSSSSFSGSAPASSSATDASDDQSTKKPHKMLTDFIKSNPERLAIFNGRHARLSRAGVGMPMAQVELETMILDVNDNDFEFPKCEQKRLGAGSVVAARTWIRLTAKGNITSELQTVYIRNFVPHTITYSAPKPDLSAIKSDPVKFAQVLKFAQNNRQQMQNFSRSASSMLAIAAPPSTPSPAKRIEAPTPSSSKKTEMGSMDEIDE